jgi:RNA polymerase sigma factor (sigma-70 family)
MNRRLREALAAMSERDREIIEMLYLEQLETVEVAEILGVTRQVVWTRHMRAIKRMTNALDSDT